MLKNFTTGLEISLLYFKSNFVGWMDNFKDLAWSSLLITGYGVMVGVPLTAMSLGKTYFQPLINGKTSRKGFKKKMKGSPVFGCLFSGLVTLKS